MREKTTKEVRCRNPACRKFFCHRTGEHLIVGDLAVVPKTKKDPFKDENKKSVTVLIKCPTCEWTTRVYLKKQETGQTNAAGGGKEKFSIFKSRF